MIEWIASRGRRWSLCDIIAADRIGHQVFSTQSLPGQQNDDDGGVLLYNMRSACRCPPGIVDLSVSSQIDHLEVTGDRPPSLISSWCVRDPAYALVGPTRPRQSRRPSLLICIQNRTWTGCVRPYGVALAVVIKTALITGGMGLVGGWTTMIAGLVRLNAVN